MWPISIIEICIYDLPQNLITSLWSFSFSFIFIIKFDLFESKYLIVRSMPEIFDISFLRVSLWLLGIIHFQYKSFSLFPSQILVCATAFAAHYLFSRFDFGWAISQNIKEWEDIGTSLCMSQDQQNYWLIIHDKFEDLFTIIT